MEFTPVVLLALLGFGFLLMIFGIKLRLGLLNILSIIIWIYLAVEFGSSALMVILFVGLSLLQVYLVVWGVYND